MGCFLGGNIHRPQAISDRSVLQHLYLNRGVQRQHKLWTESGQRRLWELPLEGWAGVRREDLLALLGQLDGQIGRLDEAVERAVYADPEARLLMSQPGVGPVTALAFALTVGEVSRFKNSKQVSS